MKKTLMIIAAILVYASSYAAIVGVQNDDEAAFYEGKTKVASWTFNADGSIDVLGNTINGDIKVLYGSKEKQRSVVYKIKDNVIQDGTYAWAFKSGEPAGEETYNSGKRDGKFKFFYKSGKTSKEGAYKEGKKNGDWRLYFENNGELAEEGIYKDGVKNGEWTICYPGGEQKERYTYVNDKKHGTYQQFYRSGTIKMEGIYKNDIKDGKFFKYFESGEDAGIETYVAGKKVSDTTVEEEESEAVSE